MRTIAKLTRPKTHRVLRRGRLFSIIDEARDRPLVWLSGPPGAGKSTLVASYIDANKSRAAWYHLDAGDDDVGTFFYYLAQSQPSSSKRAENLPLLTPDRRGELASFSRHFFRQYFAREMLLVLDNYHELSESSPVHEVLDCAICEVPQGCNIVVVSRGEPPRRFARHRLAEKLATIEADELRVSLDETREIAALRHHLDEATINRIHALTHGWAAGLALALQRAQQVRAARGEAKDKDAAEELFEFFASQVFASTPAPLQEFLQLTSLLPTMTAAMAQQLTGRHDSEATLEDLYRRGMFTDRRATEPLTYQYHDLFRAFLARRYEKATDRQTFAKQMHRAGTLLEAAGQADHAVRLFLRAGQWPAARKVILTRAVTLIGQGRGTSVSEWINAMPRELVAQDPWLMFWAGSAQLRIDPVTARTALMAAFEIFRASGDTDAQTVACAAIVHSYTYEFADLTPLDPWIDEFQRLLDGKPKFPSSAAEMEIRTGLLLALSLRRPRRGPLGECIDRMLELLSADVPDPQAAMACGALLIHFFSIGDVTMGDRIAAHLRTVQGRGHIPPLVRALGEIQIGRHCFEKHDDPAAVRAFESARRLAAEHGISLPVVTVYATLGLALCAVERGDVATAELHRQEIEAWWKPKRRIDEFATMRLQLWLACRRGQWQVALSLARRQIACALDCGVFWFAFEARIQCAMVCAELDRGDELQEMLALVRPMVEHTGYENFVYQVELTEAYYALRRGDLPTCHEKLRAGLARGRPDHGKRTLRMHPAMLSRLFAEALRAGIDVEHVQESIRLFHISPPSRDVRNWPWPLRIYTLGQFDVLRDGQPLEYSRKAPKKTMALLKAIIAFGGTNVREQRLVDAFWSDEEGDVATRSLSAALHRLRKLIGDVDAIVQQGNALSLDRSRVWVDAWAFDDLLARPETPQATELLDLYRGGFLVQDEGEPWSVTMRERLRGKFIHAIGEIGQHLEHSQRPEAAIECYLRGLDADPVIEQFYQGLMRCYVSLERRSEALSAYLRLKRMLSISLGLAPSPQTERLYQSLRPHA